MVEKLNTRSITPKQYVKHASQDNVPTDEITEELVGWGEKWKGTDFSDPEAFSVNEKWITSRNPARRFMRLRDRSCQLDVHKSNKDMESESSSFDARLNSASIAEHSLLTTEQKGKGTTPKHLGRRGGSIELMDVQKVTENGLEMSTQCYKDSPNLVYEVSTEEVQAVSDRPVLRSYTFVSPGEISPIFYYIFAVIFVFTSSVVVEYLLRKLSRWTNPKNSASTMQQNESPSGEEQELEESATKATPQLLFEIFKSYQSKTISKKKATHILVNFYNLSEIEAIHLLDE